MQFVQNHHSISGTVLLHCLQNHCKFVTAVRVKLSCGACQVIWVDLLTKAEFEAGFGSHTPMFSGQTKCVRYYMNFGRALRLMKEVIAQEGHTFDANNKPGMLALQLTNVQWSSRGSLMLITGTQHLTHPTLAF